MSRFLMVSLLLFSFSSSAFAWGGRGHHAICSVAVHFVQNKILSDFLKQRPHTMGHLCNVPDIYWKSLGAVSKSGDFGHYIDPDILPVPLSKIPEKFADVESQYTGTPDQFHKGRTIMYVPNDLGTLWWRADQFYRRIVDRKEALRKIKPPENRGEEQKDDLPYNSEIYGMMLNMGLMGHFIGDASQPFHVTANHDGYETGNGGIHSYYEEGVVSQAPVDFESRIAQKAAGMKKEKFLEKASVIEHVRRLTEISQSEIAAALKKDPITKKSERREEKGMKIPTRAERKSTAEGWKIFGPMITVQMARSAKLLATLWDQAYLDAGSPDLSAYRSYRYPFTPDFVPLDYVSAPKVDAEKSK